MLALALETSGRVGSVALADDGRVVAEEQFPHGLQHAARIITVIDALCRGRSCAAGDLREIYVSVGPGSFTGLRIGITAAKTLAMVTAAKVVAVATVNVLVENAPAEARNVVIVLDAKRGQIFTARFRREGDAWVEEEAAHVDTLAGMMARSPRPVHLLGEGTPYHLASIDPTDRGVILTDPTAWRARAGVVAELGLVKARRGEFIEGVKLTPLYIRVPEAEEKRST